MISKGGIVNGTYALMRISGLTVDPTPEDEILALQTADDYAGQLLGDGLNINWQQPANYGESDPADNSGLTNKLVGAFKKLLYIELCSAFGKEVPIAIAKTAREGMRTLEQILITVPDAELPATVPFGSGNEWDYRDRVFYDEPADTHDAIYVFLNDILNYSEDFSDWLVDETLVTVEWTATPTSGLGITIGTNTFTDTVAKAELTFVQIGGYTVNVTATKTGSTDKLTRTRNFIINDPNPNVTGGVV